MTIELEKRQDFTLETFARVAWAGDEVSISTAAQDVMRCHREQFMALLENEPELHIYGVTSGYGQHASLRLEGEARQQHAANPPFASMTGFGGEMPERLKRGIVLARLINMIEGHAAVTPELAVAIAATLHQRLPRVPLLGSTSAGEIIPLSHLFAGLYQSFDFAEKETLALINGSPCATAVMADVALSTEARLHLALDVFALSVEALAAPLEAYDDVLDPLCGDPHLVWVMEQLRQRVTGAQPQRRGYQAPVSWRILPQVIGQAVRAHGQLLQLASTALQAVSDNPVYVAAAATGDPQRYPYGRVLSTGGYHHGGCCAALDAIAGSCADLALLCDRHVSKLLDGNVSGLPPQLRAGDGYLGCVGFIAADYAEQARKAAVRTPLLGSEGGGFGQNDVLVPVFHAWRQCQEAGMALDACLAVLAATVSQAFSVAEHSRCPAALTPLLEDIRFHVPPLVTPRAMGASIGALADSFTQRVYAECQVS